MANKTLSDAEALSDTIQATIDEGRIGTPQFFRCIATVSAANEFVQVLDELRSLANRFFDGPTCGTHVMTSDGVYSTEMLKWPEGQSAIITVSLTEPDSAPNLDLMLIGSKGTLYHDDPLGGC